MIPAKRPYNVIIFIQHRVTAVPALQHDLLDVIQEVIQMEGHQIVRLCDAAHGDRLVDEPCCAVSFTGSGDDAGIRAL